MSLCAPLTEQAAAGVAPALRAVDCLAGETTATAFARLFGPTGGLAPALTILLTLYIALFALALITGRTRLGVAALTPRMLTIGLVLTFATSWIAYQTVLWNLAVAAPDQVAALITGSKGPATQIFADRIDMIFGAIADVAGQDQQAAANPAATGMGSPSGVLWLGALLLLLGTVGVLVTARIALAVLLATGPVFVVLAQFPGTRGLTAGWLRGVVMTALIPLFVVVGGGIALELLVPIVAGLRGLDGELSGRAAMALFLVAAVHCALMALVGKVAATTVSAWSVFGLAAPASRAGATTESPLAPRPTLPALQAAPFPRSAATFTPAPLALDPAPATAQPSSGGSGRTVIHHPGASYARPSADAPRRARGIGSRFHTASAPIGILR